MKRLLGYFLSGAIALSMAVPAMAKARDHHTSGQWREHHERDSRRDVHRGEYRHARSSRRDGDDRPNGWDKGRKTGWHGGSLPPGQAKKHRDYRDPWVRDRHHHHRTTYSRNRAPIAPQQNPYPTRTYPSQQTQHGRGPIPVPTVSGRPTTTAQKPSGQGGPIPVAGR